MISKYLFCLAGVFFMLPAPSARAQSVPVTFGTPDSTDVAPGSSSSWTESWDSKNTGTTNAKLFVRFQPDQRVSITPNVNGHAINTKGTRTAGRFSLTPVVKDTPLYFKKNYVGHVTLIKQRTVVALFGVGDYNGTDNNDLEMDFTITAPDTFTFRQRPNRQLRCGYVISVDSCDV